MSCKVLLNVVLWSHSNGLAKNWKQKISNKSLFKTKVVQSYYWQKAKGMTKCNSWKIGLYAHFLCTHLTQILWCHKFFFSVEHWGCIKSARVSKFKDGWYDIVSFLVDFKAHDLKSPSKKEISTISPLLAICHQKQGQSLEGQRYLCGPRGSALWQGSTAELLVGARGKNLWSWDLKCRAKIMIEALSEQGINLIFLVWKAN